MDKKNRELPKVEVGLSEKLSRGVEAGQLHQRNIPEYGVKHGVKQTNQSEKKLENFAEETKWPKNIENLRFLGGLPPAKIVNFNEVPRIKNKKENRDAILEEIDFDKLLKMEKLEAIHLLNALEAEINNQVEDSTGEIDNRLDQIEILKRFISTREKTSNPKQAIENYLQIYQESWQLN